MLDYPKEVLDTLKELQLMHKHTLSIKVINEGYYVYEMFSKLDKIEMRKKSYNLYIGKIENNGNFIKPHRKNSRTFGVRTSEGYMRSREREEIRKRKEFEEIQNKIILSAFSSNARRSAKPIADALGISLLTVHNRLKKLEKRFDIRYTIDTQAAYNFGFFRFIITVKFNSQRPDRDTLKKIFENEPNVQFAATTKGPYDLFIYTLFENPLLLENWLYKLRKKKPFLSKVASWNASYFLIGHGVIPFRDEFFRDIVAKKVWHRTKEEPHRRSDQIFKREYAVLRALNKNGRTQFKDIDKEFGLAKGSARYTFDEMVKKGTIRRATLSMQKPPIGYLAIMTMHIMNLSKFEDSRKEYFLYTLKDKKLWTNRFSVIGDLGSPHATLFITPVYYNGDLEKVEEELIHITKSEKIESAVITDMIVGSICVNKVEISNLTNYKALIDEYKMTEEEIINYITKNS